MQASVIDTRTPVLPSPRQLWVPAGAGVDGSIMTPHRCADEEPAIVVCTSLRQQATGARGFGELAGAINQSDDYFPAAAAATASAAAATLSESKFGQQSHCSTM